MRDLVLFGGVMLMISLPVALLARRRNRPRVARGFLITAAVGTVLTAVVTTTSDMLIRQCLDAGNTSCVDYGSSGFVFLTIGGVAVAAAIAAWILYREY